MLRKSSRVGADESGGMTNRGGPPSSLAYAKAETSASRQTERTTPPGIRPTITPAALLTVADCFVVDWGRYTIPGNVRSHKKTLFWSYNEDLYSESLPRFRTIDGRVETDG